MNKLILSMMLITSGCSFYAPKAPAIPSDIQSNPATLRVDNFFDNRVQQERELHFVKKYIVQSCINCGSEESIIPKSHKLGFWFYAQNADKILITGEVNQVNALCRELRKSGSAAQITQQYSNGLTTVIFYKKK